MQTPSKKLNQTPHEKRVRQSLDRQVSMQDRMQTIRKVMDDEAPRDLSPSQREHIISEEIKEYQKPELIRQAIKNVKNNADA